MYGGDIMYDAESLARECHVSVDTVYRVRKQLDLDRLPTVDEINARNTKRGQRFKRCPNNKTSKIDKYII